MKVKFDCAPPIPPPITSVTLTLTLVEWNDLMELAQTPDEYVMRRPHPNATTDLYGLLRHLRSASKTPTYSFDSSLRA